MSQLEEIVVIFRGEKHRWDDTIIGEADLESAEPGTKTQSVTLKGTASVGELVPLSTYRFYGKWSTYRNKRTQAVQKQFEFQTFVKAQPHSRAGVINYLKLAPHIGQRVAETLWDNFGGDAVRVVRESPELAAAAVDGRHFTLKKAKKAAEHFKEEQAMEGCMIDLIDVLQGRGFPKKTSRAAIGAWGNKAAQVIKRCPYYLMNFRGCSFARTDAMYLDLGLPPGKLKRQALCARNAVASEKSGHVWYPVKCVEDALRSKIGGTEVRFEKALELARRGRLIDILLDEFGNRWTAEYSAARAEKQIAICIAESESEKLHWPVMDMITGISDHQHDNLSRSLRGTICMLGGAPGTGKTFTAAALIRALVREFGADCIAVGAPTGKAAVRVTENLQKYNLVLRARTIHSLLGVSSASRNGDSWSFIHNEENPLDERFIIIDEASMIDNSLMASLLKARAKGTHILFIGDIHQLPPVGRGAPLRDLISASVPYAELTEIRRNSGAIVRACHDIKNGHDFQTSGAIDLNADDPENLFLVPAVTPDLQIEKMTQWIAAAKADNLDPMWDVQVVVGVNARSGLSRKALNKLLQEHLNARGTQATGNPFRVRDKIVNLKNGFFEVDEGIYPGFSTRPIETDPDIETDEDGKVYAANGELAEVLQVEPNLTIARLSNPTRVVKIPRANTKSEPEKKAAGFLSGAKNEADNEDTADTGCSWDLGYALSVHKSQGSEWPLVIVMLDEYPGARMVCSREWLYTAISRARRLCLMIGKMSTATGMCRRQALGKRKTFLVERIAVHRDLISPAKAMVQQREAMIDDRRSLGELQLDEVNEIRVEHDTEHSQETEVDFEDYSQEVEDFE